jgi:hypothetical protein
MKNSTNHSIATGGKGNGIKPNIGSPETTTRIGTGGNSKRPKPPGR